MGCWSGYCIVKGESVCPFLDRISFIVSALFVTAYTVMSFLILDPNLFTSHALDSLPTPLASASHRHIHA